MVKQILKGKAWVITVLLVTFTVLNSSNAFARGDHGGHGRDYYRGGHRYNSGWFWGSFATGIAIGTIFSKLPPRHETVYVRGATYHHCDGVYYRPCSTGYVVVPAPATTTIVTASPITWPSATSWETLAINIPNANGGYTSVTLTKHKTGYLGPQGEYYEGHPSVEQLRVLYGR